MRGFLADSGARLPPWSASDEVQDELVRLFHARRDDSAFFERLTPFLKALRESAARGESGLPAHDAEVLSQATVESLVEELRTALRSAPREASSSLLRSLMGERAAAALSLALLATGVSGCTLSPAPEANNEPGTPAPLAPLPAAPLKTMAPVAAPTKLSNDQLVEMFRQKSPEEAAKALERAVDAAVAAPSNPSGPAPRPDLEVGSKPRYKGVELW